MRWSVRTRLLCAVTVLCLVAVASAVFSVLQTNEAHRQTDILHSILEAQTALHQARADHMEWMNALESRLYSEGESTSNFDAIGSDFGVWLYSSPRGVVDGMGEVFGKIEQEHNRLSTTALQIEDMVAVGMQGEARAAFDEVAVPSSQTMLRWMTLLDSDVLTPALEASNAVLSAARTKSRVTTVVAALAMVVTALGFGLLMHRRILTPLERIVAATRRAIDSDDLKDPLPKVGGELGPLSENINGVTQKAHEMISDAEDTSMELALGLSEYFEALKKIEGGDPEVSVSEDSSNELIAQLGKLVNRTAKGVAALVDDSHEMAMGLCANFEILTRLADGDLGARAIEDSRVELLGRLGEMINRVSGQLQVLADEASAIAGGDLTRTLQLEGDLPDAFNQMAVGLRTLVGRTREYASRVASASTQILSASEQQAAAAAEEAAQVSEIAAAAKELAATAKRVSDLGKDISKSSAASLDLAQSGIEAANDVVVGMDKIRESVLDTAKKIEALGEKSQSITEITSLIEDIADQTNLLSVNAAIEAARAGEAGKGFAVVADAIGSLAERTAKSTKDISDLIKSMQQETSACVMSMEESTQLTDQGASLAQKAGEKLRDVAGAFESVAHSAREVSLSSQQQMSASEEISKAMAEIDEIVKQSANSAKESTESARDLSELATELGEAIAQFKISTDEQESDQDTDDGTGSGEQTEESSREWHASLINQR